MSQAALILSPTVAPSRRKIRSSSDLLDYTLFFPGIWLCCGLSIALRVIGPAFLVMPTGCCFLYASFRGVVPPRWLTVLFAYCCMIAVLSYWPIFPTSWQVHYMREAIIRQLVPLIGFFAVAWASKAYFRLRIAQGDVFVGAGFIVFLSLVVAPAAMFQQGFGYQDDRSLLAVMALVGAFLNNIMIASFYIMAAIFLTRDWRQRASIAWIVLTGITTHFVQFRIVTLVTLAAFCGFPGRKLATGVVVVLLVAYGAGVNFVADTMKQDPNDGLRLALVSDVLLSAVDTNGVGVGYGKESVRWIYRFPDMPDFTFLPDAKTMSRDRMLEALSRGVENSFAMMLLRGGVVGLVLLIAVFCNAFPPRNLPRGLHNHAAAAFAMMFVTCFVNPALETPTQAVGVGFVYGYLVALRAATRRGCPQIVVSRAAPSR